MAANGASCGFVSALAMLPGSSAFAPAGANCSASLALVVVDAPAPAAGTAAPPPAVVVPSAAKESPAAIVPTAQPKVEIPAIAPAQGGTRPPMKWTNTTSGFVLRRLCQLIESGAWADKGFKEKEVNQVAKLLREFSGMEVTATQVYNHLRKWRQRWGKISKLMTLSGAVWDDCVKVIMLDPKHYEGHIKDHPKDAEFLNTPIRFYDEMQTIFGSGMETGKFAMGSNEPLGTNQYMGESGLGKMEGSNGKPMGDHKQCSQATELQTTTTDRDRKSKRSCFSEEVLIMTNMTDAVNNVANALRETGPAYIDGSLYHAVMDMPGFSEEALIVAFSHLLDNKAQATAYVNMGEDHRVLWLRTFLGKHYYM